MILMELTTSFLLQLAGSVYLYFEKKEGDRNRKKSILSFAFSVIITIIFSDIVLKISEDVLEYVNFMFLYQILFCLAIIDAKKKMIPNCLLGIGIGIRIFCCMIGTFLYKEEYIVFCMNSLIAMSILILIFGVASFVSREGIGFGDVKLLAVIGAYTDLAKTLSIALISLALAFVFALVLIWVKKKTKKDAIPFAPFLYIGFVLFTIIQMS